MGTIASEDQIGKSLPCLCFSKQQSAPVLVSLEVLPFPLVGLGKFQDFPARSTGEDRTKPRDPRYRCIPSLKDGKPQSVDIGLALCPVLLLAVVSYPVFCRFQAGCPSRTREGWRCGRI